MWQILRKLSVSGRLAMLGKRHCFAPNVSPSVVGASSPHFPIELREALDFRPIAEVRAFLQPLIDSGEIHIRNVKRGRFVVRNKNRSLAFAPTARTDRETAVFLTTGSRA